MKRALVFCSFASALAASGAAFAEWSADLKLERFRWAESTTPAVTETGPMYGIGLNWTQDKQLGWLAAYRGELYWGSVDYRGSFLFTGEPATGTTTYSGMRHEAQAIHRFAGSWEFVAGLGLDLWTRDLGGGQTEDWTVAFARLGAEAGGRATRGWFAAGGLKVPVYTSEDAHLTSIGFDQNPTLKPGKSPSAYAELGYRFSRHWTLSGYYDSYRFAESRREPVTMGGQRFLVFQPESKVDSWGVKLYYHF
jgi:hypothetical protein